MCSERFGRCHPQTQHMPLGQQVLAPGGARRPHGRSDCSAPTRDSATGGAGGRAIDRPGQIEAPRALTAHRGARAPGPDCGRVPRFRGRPHPEGIRSSPSGPLRASALGAAESGEPERSAGPQDIVALATKYLVGRPAREAEYAVPQGVLNSAQPGGRRPCACKYASNPKHALFPPAELSEETTKQSSLNDQKARIKCT